MEQVVSRGQSSGPKGVLLTMRKASTEELVKEATSAVGGDFVFENVLPGEYIIDASRPPWLFDQVSRQMACALESFYCLC